MTVSQIEFRGCLRCNVQIKRLRYTLDRFYSVNFSKSAWGAFQQFFKKSIKTLLTVCMKEGIKRADPGFEVEFGAVIDRRNLELQDVLSDFMQSSTLINNVIT